VSILIAVLEDDANVLSLMENVLTKDGYQVAPLQRHMDSYRLMVRQRPSLIILDLHVGAAILGWSTLDTIRHNAAAEDIPVIICTGDLPFLQRNHELLAAKGYGIVKKPFEV
jgi:DNA-binding response OmpR family regulator